MATSKTLITKGLLFFLLIIAESALYAQTDSLEKAAIYNKFLTKKISQETYSEIGLEWKEKIKAIGKYPDLPLDQNALVHYSFVIDSKDVSKEKLFRRTLEALAVNYGLFPANLYSNLEDGRIIFNNSFTIDDTFACNYTSVVTIKNEKVLIEYINILYHAFYPGHYSNEVWIADKNIDFSPDHFYPIALLKPSVWDWNLNLLKTTNEHLNHEFDKIFNYFNEYDSNSVF